MEIRTISAIVVLFILVLILFSEFIYPIIRRLKQKNVGNFFLARRV